MKEIVVISGKGGTGKTSVTASLAYLAGSTAIVADCDVDAADMHLLMKPNTISTEDFFSGESAHIIQDICISCGRCEEVCRFDAINHKGMNYKVDPISCEGCGYCSKICPVKAIYNTKRKVGNLFVSNVKTNTKMVHAKLAIGADNSGKLVAYVKKKAKEIALQEQKDFIIVDGSPGIGCPVISSLSGANMVLFVTEPTLSAFQDLKRVLALINKFKIPACCIINKADLNTEIYLEIRNFLEEESIPLLASLPYSSIVSQKISLGEILTESQNEISVELQQAWQTLKTILG